MFPAQAIRLWPVPIGAEVATVGQCANGYKPARIAGGSSLRLSPSSPPCIRAGDVLLKLSLDRKEVFLCGRDVGCEGCDHRSIDLRQVEG